MNFRRRGPPCNCNQHLPIYEKVVEPFKDNSNVIIAKIDSTFNELPHTKVSSFPTIKLITKGGENKVIGCNTNKSLRYHMAILPAYVVFYFFINPHSL